MAPINIFDVWLGFLTEQVSIISNSTISNIQTNMTQKIMRFNATGGTGVGFCRVDIPNTIVSECGKTTTPYLWTENHQFILETGRTTSKPISTSYTNTQHVR